ncbi:MAG: Fic family protein, partial [Bacteroidota bacterium]
NWPNFEYSQEELPPYEAKFFERIGVLRGSLRHLAANEKYELKVVLISNEAYKSSEIEGEILDRNSLQSSIRRQFGLKNEMVKGRPAEYGISEMMVSLYKTFQKELSRDQLFEWHSMLMNGRRDLSSIGGYRTHAEPMQIVSNVMNAPVVYFEAPPSESVSEEMDQFIDWFNQTAPGMPKELDGLLRASIAHIYFESIHPFEDGNGRIGRAISEKALAQAVGEPTLLALSHLVEKRRKEYYHLLHKNSLDLDIQSWLEFFIEVILESQTYTLSLIDFLIEQNKFFHRFDVILNDRQKKVVKRIFKEGVNGFDGGLSAGNYQRITSSSPATATRDLKEMVEIGAFRREGKGKYSRYYLNIQRSFT